MAVLELHQVSDKGEAGVVEEEDRYQQTLYVFAVWLFTD